MDIVASGMFSTCDVDVASGSSQKIPVSTCALCGFPRPLILGTRRENLTPWASPYHSPSDNAADDSQNIMLVPAGKVIISALTAVLPITTPEALREGYLPASGRGRARSAFTTLPERMGPNFL